MQKKYEVKLELYANSSRSTDIQYYTNDENVYPIFVTLTKDGDPYEIPEDAVPYVVFKTPSGEVDRRPATLEPEAAGLLRYDIIGSEISVRGKVEASVCLVRPSEQLTWQGFGFSVVESLDHNGSVPPEPYAEWTRDIDQRVTALEQGGGGGGASKEYVDQQDALTLETATAALAEHTTNLTNPHAVTKAQIGLSAVDNTSDADKPVSAAQKTALDAVEAELNGALDATNERVNQNTSSITAMQPDVAASIKRDPSTGVASPTDLPAATEDDPGIIQFAPGIGNYPGRAADAADVFIALPHLSHPNAGSHNAIYRGKYLGDHVTDEQYAAINAGTFEDLYIGDYWTIGGVNYRIAAFDYYLNTGDVACTVHHVTLVPDTSMYNHAMNDTNTTAGGYVGSKMYTEGLTQAKATINAAFGAEHILSHRQYLVNAVTNGRPSGAAWFESTVELMTEQNLYGGKVFGVSTEGGSMPAIHTVDKSQYALFACRPDLIGNRQSFWLRDAINSGAFAHIHTPAYASFAYAVSAWGVRPAFSITA